MKKILAALLAMMFVATTAGCAQPAAEADYPATQEQIVLSRADPEPYATEGEFPSVLDAGVLGESIQSAPPNGESPAPVLDALAPKAPLQAAASQDEFIAGTEEAPAAATVAMPDEVRAMWFSFYDLSPMLQGRTESQFKASITGAFQNCKDIGLNTMIVQVRPHGDALYPSQYFPWSHWLDANDEEGNNPGYDPLAIMVDAAHGLGLRIEAWINPYRIRTDDKHALSGDNKAVEWLNAGSDSVVRHKGGLYYNPARKDAQNLIIDGVKEVVRNYRVDGIHFDDYFYPEPSDAFDQQAYNDYRTGGGTKGRADWRRANVDTLVKAVYSAIKSVNKNVIFGISPQGNRSNNYNLQYSDVDKWASSSGYVDYICPQIYWGFNHTSAPFRQVAREWEACVTNPDVKLYIGLASYKIGGPEADFKNYTNNMQQQVVASRALSNYDGFFLFRYDSLFNPAANVRSWAEQERNNLQSVLN